MDLPGCKTRDASGRSTIHTSCCLGLHPVVPLLAWDASDGNGRFARSVFGRFLPSKTTSPPETDTRGKAATTQGKWSSDHQ